MNYNRLFKSNLALKRRINSRTKCHIRIIDYSILRTRNYGNLNNLRSIETWIYKSKYNKNKKLQNIDSKTPKRLKTNIPFMSQNHICDMEILG